MTTQATGQAALVVFRFDRVAPLLDGTVSIPNVQVIHSGKGGEGLLKGLFEAAELQLSRYVFSLDQGDPITAVPVFPDRIFFHYYLYTRPDAGIRSPADLKGRRVMAPGYFYTILFWQRAMLQEQYGIRPEDIEWFVPGPEIEPRYRFPDSVRVQRVASTWRGAQALLDGTVDALLLEATPIVAPQDRHRVVPVIPDVHAVLKDWYRKTKFFPIVHLIAIRKDALATRPELGVEICRGYDQAKDITYRRLQNERMTSLPLMRLFADEMTEIGGDDPWSYGLEPNRAELEKFLDYAHDQGLTRRRIRLDELFDERSLSYRFAAKMVRGGGPT